MAKKTQLTKEQIEKVSEKRAELNKEYDDLMEKMESGGYNKQAYPEDSEITLPGEMFVTFINTLNNTKQVLENTVENLNIIHYSLDSYQNDIASLTVDFMKQHIKNVDNGDTKPEEDVEKEKSKKKVKEIKNKN